MKMAIRWIIPSLALVAFGCGSEPDDSADTTPAAEASPPPAPAPATPMPMTSEVKGEGTGSAIAGQATITPTATGFDFAVNLTGLPAGAHAWHIHQGACGTADAPVVVPFSGEEGKPGLSTDLTADASGTATATVAVPSATLSVDQIHAGGYSLHVHAKAGKDHGATIACSDLK